MPVSHSLAPSRDDFTALLNETYGEDEAFEGSVIKGRVVAIEKDMALIDIGLKTEGRVALKEFTNHGRDPSPKVGDEVEVYLERIENALGEAGTAADIGNVRFPGTAGRIQLDLDGLTWPHVRKLRLFEVCCHPDIGKRHYFYQLLSDADVLAHFN